MNKIYGCVGLLDHCCCCAKIVNMILANNIFTFGLFVTLEHDCDFVCA